MYGEGYDWTPLYSVRSGQMVGALPVGIETKGFDDAPYWPTQICWTYKEVWTQPVGQWIWLMQDIAVAATVRGTADPARHEPVEFREKASGQLTGVASVASDGELTFIYLKVTTTCVRGQFTLASRCCRVDSTISICGENTSSISKLCIKMQVTIKLLCGFPLKARAVTHLPFAPTISSCTNQQCKRSS